MALTLSGSALGLGKVLQVVMGSTTTRVASSTSTYADTGLTATITPSSTTSKVLVLISQNGLYKASGYNTWGGLRLVRNSTPVVEFEGQYGYTASTAAAMSASSLCYLDSPTTTSATTYKTQVSNTQSTGFVTVQESGCSTIILVEVAP